MKHLITRTLTGALAGIATYLLPVVAVADVDIQEITTDAGFQAWLVEEPTIPFVSLELRFEGGASLDPEGKRGVTNLMVGLLEEGSGDLDARGFAEAQEALAASFGYDVSDDSVSVSARFLTENQTEAMALLRESLINPRFDQDAIDRVRAQVISSIRSDATDPDTIARETASAKLYGDHPYATMIDGTEDSVTALTRDDLIAAHKGTIAKDRIYIGAAGDITSEELSKLIDALLADLPETGLPLPQDVDITTTAGITVVPFDVPQSVALFGHRGIPRDDPDFFPAFVLNHAFGGGGFESRLMTEVREKRGLTYGIYSYILNKRHADLMMGRVASANDRIAEAIDVIKAEWAEVAENGISEEALEEAKTYLTGAYPLRFDSNAAIADIMVGMQFMGLTPEYITSRNDRVAAVTMDDIKRVAKRLLLTDELHFVVVGQPEGLESTPSQ